MLKIELPTGPTPKGYYVSVWGDWGQSGSGPFRTRAFTPGQETEALAYAKALATNPPQGGQVVRVIGRTQ